MDIFNNSAFSMTSLSGAIKKVGYKPQLLGSLGIYEPMPVRTRAIFVERTEGKLRLIPSSPIGAPPKELVTDPRNAVPLKTTRLAEGFTLYAEEIQGIRAFGSETELAQVQAEYLKRMASVRDDMDLTHEYHRLGEPAAIDFDLDNATPATGALRLKCAEVIRGMARSAAGAFTPGTTIHALVGDAFYDALITHPEVEKTYLNWQAAADLRQDRSFQAFTYGGITWHNYQGTDDNSTVAIDPDEAKFFPVGAKDVFKKAMAPAEFGPYVNTLGQDTYAMNIPDRDRQAWTRGELYSYPLYFCQRPDVLRKGVK
jgi:hypothetical protein